MAAIVANTGSNNWNTNGAWVGGVQPGAGDDVTIPATAVVTIPTAITALARSVTVAASGTVAFATTTSILTIGDATAGAGNVALSVSATATITLTGIGVINFASTSATQQTIATGGKTVPTINITGAGCSYLLSDGFTSSGVITHSAGTFNTGNQAISCATLNNGNTTTRTLTLGSSVITATGTTAWTTTATTGLTVTSNTATITCTAAAATAATQSLNWQGLSLAFATTCTSPQVQGSGSLRDFSYTSSAIKTSTLMFTSSPTFTGAFSIAGNTVINRVFVQSSAVGTSRTVTVGTSFALSNADFMDITAAGAAGTWTGSSMGNALGCSNITFDTPATQTHTASAGGNWSDVTKWTSRVPLPQDSVVIDVNTTGTITADMPRLGADITFTGFVGTADFSSTPNSVFGSPTLASGMTVSGTQTLTLAARSSKTITSSTKIFTQAITITNPSGTYTLADAFNTAGILTIGNGTFTTSGFTVDCSTMISATGTINLGASTVNLNSTANTTVLSLSGTNTLNAGTSNIVIATISASARTILCQGRTVATITYTIAGSAGALALNTALSTIGTLNFSDSSNARTVTFQSGFTTTFTGAFNVRGTAGKLMTINSSTAASAATVSKASGIVSCDYVSIKDSTATGGATWYAGANSTSVSGNTGWLFTAAPFGNFFRFF